MKGWSRQCYQGQRGPAGLAPNGAPTSGALTVLLGCASAAWASSAPSGRKCWLQGFPPTVVPHHSSLLVPGWPPGCIRVLPAQAPLLDSFSLFCWVGGGGACSLPVTSRALIQLLINHTSIQCLSMSAFRTGYQLHEARQYVFLVCRRVPWFPVQGQAHSRCPKSIF